MENLETQPTGVLSTAQYLASHETPFRTYVRTLALGLTSLVMVVTSIVGAKYWGSYSSVSAAAMEIQSQDIHDYKQALMARAELEREPEPEPVSPIVMAVAKSPVGPVAPAGSLDEVISRWKQAHPGIKLGIVVREIDNQKRVAVSGEDSSFFAASLYKLHLVHYLYDRVEKGNLDIASTLGSDKTVGECIDAMMVFSENDCAEGIANAVGWNNVDAFTHEKGFVKTSLHNGVIRASAADTAEFLAQLDAGTLLNAEHTEHMLDLMKRQVFRKAIPAGIADTVVADKVGFYNGTWNDAGIVYGPKCKYVLSILTQGGSAASIADLSRQIAEFLNQ